MSLGCVSNENQDNKNKINKKTNKNPVANASNIQQIGFINEPINFQGVGFDPDGEIILYEWDFDGDGVFDYLSNSTGNVTYIYRLTGQFNVTFKVTDDKGTTATDNIEIDVVEKMPPAPPEVWFTYPKNQEKVNEIITIIGHANTDDNRVYVLSVEIKIGDGNWIETNYTINNYSYPEVNWSFILDTTNMPNGEHIVSVRTLDNHYGTIEDNWESIQIIIENSKEHLEKIEAYTFHDNKNNTAWEGVADTEYPVFEPTKYMNKTFDISGYNYISNSNDEYEHTVSFELREINGKEEGCPYQLFKFKLLQKDFKKLYISWEGYGEFFPGEPNGTKLYVWNNINSDWFEIGNYSGKSNDQTINKTLDDKSDYIVDNNNLFIMAFCPIPGVGRSSSEIATDFITISIYN